MIPSLLRLAVPPPPPLRRPDDVHVCYQEVIAQMLREQERARASRSELLSTQAAHFVQIGDQWPEFKQLQVRTMLRFLPQRCWCRCLCCWCICCCCTYMPHHSDPPPPLASYCAKIVLFLSPPSVTGPPLIYIYSSWRRLAPTLLDIICILGLALVGNDDVKHADHGVS